MSPVTTRRVDEEEDEDQFEPDVAELEEDDADDQVVAAGPAVSDSRRRRMMKRGEVPEIVSETAQPARKDRPTPSQREEPVKSKNPVARFVQNIRLYLKDTDAELRKVAWLNQQETLRLTYIVLIVTAASAVFLGLLSYLFGVLVAQIANQNYTVVAGLLTIVLIVGVALAWLLRDRLFGGSVD